ncbi:hypothetical protein Tco_0109080 [Tanacetum coccineum]
MAPGRRPTINRNPPVNRSTNRNNVDINSGIDTQMLNQLIATRVAEALAAAAEFRAVMHENFHGTEGAVGLTRWFEKLESQFGISNVAEGDRVKFASSTLLDGALTWWNVNEIKQMENELWNLKVKGTNLTAYNQRFQETLSLLCPKMVPNAIGSVGTLHQGLPLSIKGNVTSSKPVDLHEAIEMAQGLMYQVVQELGETGRTTDMEWKPIQPQPTKPTTLSNLKPEQTPRRGQQKGCLQPDKAGHKAIRLPSYTVYKPRGPGSQGGQGRDVTVLDV